MKREIENYLKIQKEQFPYKVYRNITQYSMIYVEKAIKENQIKKDDLQKEYDEMAKLEFQKPQHLQNFAFASYYQRRIKAVKTNWKELETILSSAVAIDIVKRQKEKIEDYLKENFPNHSINLDDYDITSFTTSKLHSMVQKNLKWLKRHYNSMQRIKKYKKLHAHHYYWNVTKVKKKIGSRAEANVIRGANRTSNTRQMVLEQALLLRDQNMKITIDSVHKQINNNGFKLGKTQLAKYLKTLRAEGEL